MNAEKTKVPTKNFEPHMLKIKKVSIWVRNFANEFLPVWPILQTRESKNVRSWRWGGGGEWRVQHVQTRCEQNELGVQKFCTKKCLKNRHSSTSQFSFFSKPTFKQFSYYVPWIKDDLSSSYVLHLQYTNCQNLPWTKGYNHLTSIFMFLQLAQNTLLL